VKSPWTVSRSGTFRRVTGVQSAQRTSPWPQR